MRCPKPGLEVHLRGEIQQLDKDLFSADDWETKISDDYDVSAEEATGGVVRYVPHRDNDLDGKLRCAESGSYRAVVRLSGGGDTDERTSAEREIEC